MRQAARFFVSTSAALLFCQVAFAAKKQPEPAPEPPPVVEPEPVPEEPRGIPAPPDVAAPPADAQRTPSGIAYKVLEKGEGTRHPTTTSKVTVDYTGWTTDGEMFDSSVVRGESISFPLNGVISGWTEGVQLMAEGDVFRFWIPQELAYKGQAGAPAGTLVFDIHLVSFVTPPPVPFDVARPPTDAQTTATGLVHKQLQKGTGTANPGPDTRVTVHYSGWMADGQLIDSSVARGEPLTIRLDEVMGGWQEGIQLMVVGEKKRFWIPQPLSYHNKPGTPPGVLCFDIELIAIEAP